MSRPVLIRIPGSLRVLAAATVIAITSGCGSQGNVRSTPAPPDPLTTANRLLSGGNYAAAADAFVVLAQDSDAARADALRARAALAYQDAGDFENADVLVSQLGSEATHPAVTLAKARSMLAAGFAADAFALASGIDETPLSPYQRGVRARIVGKAGLELGRIAEAAHAWTDAYRYPFPPSESEAIRESTWRAVSRLPQSELSRLSASGDPTSRGWYELALIASKSMFDSAVFADGSNQWRQRYPSHPAATLVEQLQERSETMSVRPRRVALLLPFDEALGAAARAVRDGFITAWFADTRATTRPDLRVYSSAEGDIVETYQRAVADGAEFVVGPLRKQHVETLRTQSDLATGVLALNVIDSQAQQAAPPTGFYQFGLTPEDEAAQVARHAHAHGSRALLMAPDSVWGQRLMRAYSATWQSLGGTVLAEVPYANRSEAYPDAVRRALNIDLSEARAAGLRRRLGLPLHFEPRRRADVDVILLAGFPDNARQLLPQLRYFRAESVPVFATSHVYAGGTDAERDRDLDGLTFADMPWLFGAADAATFTEVRRNWPKESASYARLYGLGADAYRIIPYLARMRFQQSLRIPGATGVLWMDPGGIVRRNMTWLRFSDGIPGFESSSRAERVN